MDIFKSDNQKNDAISETIKINSNLRDTYLKYQELVQRGKLSIRKNKYQSNQIDFDLSSQLYFFRNKDHLFFQHPDKQQAYYRDIMYKINDQMKQPKLNKFHLQLPSIQIDNLNAKMIKTFKRRIDSLKVRKIKTIRRNEINDSYFKQRIQLIDAEIISLNNRINRLKNIDQFHDKVDVEIKNHKISSEQQIFSNICQEDIEIYIRHKITNRKLKKSVFFQFNKFQVLKDSANILSQTATINIQTNLRFFDDYLQDIQSKLSLKLLISRELMIQFNDYLKPLKFVITDDGHLKTLTKRYDRIPLIINSQNEAQSKFQQSCLLYLNQIPENAPLQKIIYQMSQLVHMLEGFQRYLSNWECHEQTEYSGIGGLQKLIIELGAFDDAQELKEQLRAPLPIYHNIQFTYLKNDWLHHLDTRFLIADQYQEYMKDKLSFVTIDIQTQKIIKLLPISLCKGMQQCIDEEMQMLRSNEYHLFNLIENYDYIEHTREDLRLSQINEILNQSQNKVHYRHKTKFKGEFSKKLEETLRENLPHESILQAHFSIQCTKMRDFQRKLLYITNAIKVIERKLTFDLLYLRKCKIDANIDSEFLIKVSHDTSQNIDVNPMKQRKAMISYSHAEEQRNDIYKQDLPSDYRMPEIIYNEEEVPDVFVKYKNQYVIYDCSQSECNLLLDRIARTVSIFINKFEKLTVLNKIVPLVDRFQCILDCLEMEAKYQFRKLKYLQIYLKLYQNICDPFQAYQVLSKIFEISKEIPLIDTQGFYFKDSYQLNLNILDQKIILLSRLCQDQEQHYLNYNKEIHQKYRMSRNNLQQNIVEKEQILKQEANNPVDEFYDYFQVSNKMTKIFQEINKSNKEPVPNNNIVQNSQVRLLDYRVELLPHWIFERNQNFNFYEYQYVAHKNLQECELNCMKINEQFPQKSILSYLALQQAYYQSVKIQEKSIELNPLLDSEYGLFQFLQQSCKQMDIQENLQYLKLNEMDLNFENYKILDKQLAINLLEYLKMRRIYCNIVEQTKQLHQQYKTQRGYTKMSKNTELYWKGNISTVQKKKSLFSAYFYEIDATMEQHFLQCDKLELLAFQDVIEEYKLMINYNHLNCIWLQIHVQCWDQILQNSLKLENDILILQQYGYLVEDTQITEKDLILVDYSEKVFLNKVRNFRKFTQLPFHNQLKGELIIKLEKKLQERQHIQSNERNKIIQQKKNNNFKLYLIRQLLKDTVFLIEAEFNRKQLANILTQLKRLTNILPNISVKQINSPNIIQALQQYPLSILNQEQIFKQDNCQSKYLDDVDVNFHIDCFYNDSIYQTKSKMPEFLKYYSHLEQLLYISIMCSTSKLTWWELMHFNELYLFDLSFDTYDISKELLFQANGVTNPLQSILKYDNPYFEPQLCDSNLKIQQNTVLLQSLDKMIEKVKSFHSIRSVFEDLNTFLKDLHYDENIIKNLKTRSKLQYQKIFYTYNEALFSISKDYPDSQYSNQLHMINQHLFMPCRLNSINLMHFRTCFVDDGSYDSFNSFRKNKFSGTLKQINDTVPIHRMRYSRNLCQMTSITGKINGINKIMVIKQFDEIDVNTLSKDIANNLMKQILIQLQHPQSQPIQCIQYKHYNLIKPDQDQLYYYLVENSILAMKQNISLLATYLDQEPLYIERSILQDKLVSKANASLPRVKFIQSFFNTLSQGGKQLPTAVKVSFIQGFLNRLKNKAVQVDLMSSGVGYVVSSSDLEDCVNMLNKELFTFSEREITVRMETFNQIYEAQRVSILQLEKQLLNTKMENQLLKESFESRLQGLVIAKSNQILFDMEMLKQKHQDFLKYTNGIEKRIHQELDRKYLINIEQLQFERDAILQKFNEFKQEIVTLCKQEVKFNQESILKYITNKTQDIIAETNLFKRSYTINMPDHNNNDNVNKEKEKEKEKEILFEPYQYTKALHKLREELNEQMEQTKQGYEKQLLQYKQAFVELQDSKLLLQESRRKETTLKLEIINLQQTINSMIKQKDELSEQNDQLHFEKKRLQKINDDFQQKLKSYNERIKSMEIKRRNAISVDMQFSGSEKQSAILPKLYRSEHNRQPKLKI